VSFRAARRAVALGIALFRCILLYWWRRLRGPLTLERRALWLQAACQLILSSLEIEYRFDGTPPKRGLIVANHLSYLDILILSAMTPCFFVAKAEIASWPYFGEAARSGGTIFIDRGSLASAEKVAALIAERLLLPVPTLFFPEGTSSDGSSVSRFHTRLFEPAIRAGMPITAAAIRYKLIGGAAERELCWFGDDPFLPHLWKTLGVEGFIAHVYFGESKLYFDRRAAASSSRQEIVAMRTEELAQR